MPLWFALTDSRLLLNHYVCSIKRKQDLNACVSPPYHRPRRKIPLAQSSGAKPQSTAAAALRIATFTWQETKAVTDEVIWSLCTELHKQKIVVCVICGLPVLDGALFLQGEYGYVYMGPSSPSMNIQMAGFFGGRTLGWIVHLGDAGCTHIKDGSNLSQRSRSSVGHLLAPKV